MRRSAFKLPPAAACSPSLAAVWHVSCILGKVGTVQRQVLPPSTPNNTTANLYQSQQTPPKIMIRNRNETETRLRRDRSGCGGAAELRLVSIRFKRFVQVP